MTRVARWCFFFIRDESGKQEQERNGFERGGISLRLPAFRSSAFSSLRHVQPEIGEQIGPRDQAEELVAVHHDRDPAAIEDA